MVPKTLNIFLCRDPRDDLEAAVDLEHAVIVGLDDLPVVDVLLHEADLLFDPFWQQFWKATCFAHVNDDD